VPSPGCCHLSRHAALPGDAGLGSRSSAPLPPSLQHNSLTRGIHSHPASANEPHWLWLLGHHKKHPGQIKPSAEPRAGPPEERTAAGEVQPCKNRSPRSLVAMPPAVQGQGRFLTALAWRAQRRAPPAACGASSSPHHQVFSTTPLF